MDFDFTQQLTVSATLAKCRQLTAGLWQCRHQEQVILKLKAQNNFSLSNSSLPSSLDNPCDKINRNKNLSNKEIIYAFRK